MPNLDPARKNPSPQSENSPSSENSFLGFDQVTHMLGRLFKKDSSAKNVPNPYDIEEAKESATPTTLKPEKVTSGKKLSILMKIALKLDDTGLFYHVCSFKAIAQKLEPVNYNRFLKLYIKLEELQKQLQTTETALQDASDQNNVKILAAAVHKAIKINEHYKRTYMEFERVAEETLADAPDDKNRNNGLNKMRSKIHSNENMEGSIRYAQEVLIKLRSAAQERMQRSMIGNTYTLKDIITQLDDSSIVLKNLLSSPQPPKAEILDKALQTYSNDRSLYIETIKYMRSPQFQKGTDPYIADKMIERLDDFEMDAEKIVEDTDALLIEHHLTLLPRELK